MIIIKQWKFIVIYKMTSFIEYYRENKDKKWDYYELCKNPQVQLEDIGELRVIHYDALSSNPNLTWEYVKENRDIPWSWHRLSGNSCITLDIVNDNPSEMWDYRGLSINPNLTWEYVQSLPDKDWDYDIIAKHPNITMELINSTMDNFTWNFENVTKNPNITWDFVKQHYTRWWSDNYVDLASNPNITIENIRELTINPDEQTDLIGATLYTWEQCICMLSTNPRVTWFDIIESLDLPWRMDKVTYNPNITLDIIEDNPDWDWDHMHISLNPNLTWDTVKKNGYKWNYSLLSQNRMEWFDWDNVESRKYEVILK